MLTTDMLTTTLLVALVSPTVIGDGDWPHLRGPAYDGAAHSSVFESGAFTLETAWSAALGSGYSGITIADGMAVTMGAAGAEDVLIAFDAETGDERWRQSIGPAYKGHDGSADGPISTPVLAADGTVVALSPWGVLSAHEAGDGRRRWSHDLVAEYGAVAPEYGFTTTPLVHEGRVIVQIGGPDGHGLGAFDLATGDLAWSTGDEEIGYQSPAVLVLAGRAQLVAFRGEALAAHDPATGAELWQLALGPREQSQEAIPTPMDDSRFAVITRGGLVVYEVQATAAGFEVEAAVRSRDLGGSYAPPVYHDGHFYGFRGDFLSCVDASSGKRVWRSRPPGGKGLLLVRDHLVVFGALGRVVIVAATPEGYREEASLEALDGSSFTWPSFAHDRIYLRNTEALVAVGVRAADEKPVVGAGAVAAAAPDADAATSAFHRFVQGLEAAEESDRAAMVEQFLEEHPALPIVEDDLVHFVYVGEASDVAIAGSMIDGSRPDPFERVPGTGFFHRSYRIAPDARIEYALQVDLGRPAPDPGNPATVPGPAPEEVLSEVVMPQFRRPTIMEPLDAPAGRVETMTWASAALGTEREVAVYLPHGYDDGGDGDESGRRYDLLLVQDGKAWRESGQLVHALDHLCGASVEPIVVAFIDPMDLWWFEAGGSRTAEYVDALADELVPELEQQYRLADGPEHRGIAGASHHGLTAMFAPFARPDVFGKAAGRSVALQLGAQNRLLELIAQGTARPVALYVDWNLYEPASIDGGFDYRVWSTELVAALEASGYAPAGGELRDAHGWMSWGGHADRMLEALFPRQKRK